ncbi:MAG: AMP-binding protein [Egibacteraceae bacterium]
MSEQVLHQVFKGWVEARPQALAVAGAAQRLTYAELDVWAGRVAAALVDVGVRREQPVAVLVERGSDLVASLLGTLVAGGAFVCLNPQHPWERLRQVLAAVSPKAVVADERSWSRHGSLIRAQLPEVVYVDPRSLETPERAAPSVTVEPGDVAYIAFTSGSTGRPKGIPHCHATLSQFVSWQGEAFGIDSAARVAQLAPQGFDVSYCEIFGALCRGASLHVAPEAIRNDPALLGAWLRQERISLLQIVPAHWRALLAELPATPEHPLPDLAAVLFVGEALAPSLVAQSRARLRLDASTASWPRSAAPAAGPESPAPAAGPDASTASRPESAAPAAGPESAAPAGGPALRLFNVYGPTEVVAATYHEVDEIPDGLRSVPIGRPIPGREILLVGEAGGVGEMYIRSPHLAKEYLDNDVETRQRFVQNPLHADYPDLVYRTGDLARRLPGGDLVFVGRCDNQVKILGQRIELEEVEAAIVGTGDVAEAVVAARSLRVGGQSLIAYVVPRGALDPDALRRRLAEILPRPMVPAVLVPVERLPRNANGKIDRDAVRGWDAPLPTDDGEQAPGSELEEAVAEIWRELLGVASVGRHADLFSLGGDSLLATRLISRVRARLGVRVALGAFFETPTIAGLAAAVSTAPRDTTPLVRRVG